MSVVIKKSDVFTPDNISKIMAEFLNNHIVENSSLLEPSVGKGNLLKFLHLDRYEKIDIVDIESEYLKHIKKIKNATKYRGNFLKLKTDKKYTHIISNPPYIRIQDLKDTEKHYIRKMFPDMKGNIDIFYAFVIKCIELLKDNGIFVSIVPNSWLYNKTGLFFRKLLIDNRYIKEIIDYGSEKVFKNQESEKEVSVYCCILILDKTNKLSFVYNKNIMNYDKIINYSLFQTKQFSKVLQDYICCYNGIATLRDKIFIHKTRLFLEPCWKEIFKVSKNRINWIIYPYNENSKIIRENEFKEKNPNIYSFLLQNKEELLRRDK